MESMDEPGIMFNWDLPVTGTVLHAANDINAHAINNRRKFMLTP
jgi:hypothetical protein